MKAKKINLINYRFAIIIDDYIYKDYASIEGLEDGVDRLHKRIWKPKFRLAKLKITTEEIEKIKIKGDRHEILGKNLQNARGTN